MMHVQKNTSHESTPFRNVRLWRLSEMAASGDFVVAFVSTRLDEKDNDGVSLEAVKWAKVLNDMGARVVFFSGKTHKNIAVSDWAQVDEAGFDDCRAANITKGIFERGWAEEDEKNALREDANTIKGHLKSFLSRQKADFIVCENLCFPANFALTLAVYETLEDTRLPYALHHHDPAQERQRFETKDPWTRKMMGMGIMGPPSNRPEKIMVINSAARDMLLDNYAEHMADSDPFLRETGIKLKPGDITVIGNKMPFESPPRVWSPKKAFDYSNGDGFLRQEPIITTEHVREFRKIFIPDEKDTVFLMPLRIIPRKFMELGLEWTRRYHERYNSGGSKSTILLLTHPFGDEGDQYWRGLRDIMKGDGFEHITLGKQKGLKFVHTGNLVGPQAKFPLGTPFCISDMTLIPSEREGWCNALAESMYYGVPAGIHPYPVFRRDIEGIGVETVKTSPITFDDELQEISSRTDEKEVGQWFEKRMDMARKLVTDPLLDRTHRLIKDLSERQKTVDNNYLVGVRHLSFESLKREFEPVFAPHLKRKAMVI